MKIRKIFERQFISDVDEEVLDIMQDFLDIFDYDRYKGDGYVFISPSNNILYTSEKKKVGFHKFYIFNIYTDVKAIENAIKTI
jgi:hypothetical protein